MATSTTTTTADSPIITPEPRPSAQAFWIKNSKLIIGVAVGIIIGIAAWALYNSFVKEPNEVKSSDLVFPAENLFDKMAVSGFSKDTVGIVLNGGNVNGETVTGLLKIYNNYGGTAAANRAAYMIGASYLHIGEFDKAIKYLKAFEGKDAAQVATKCYEMLGHAYAEKKDVNEALNYYKKAATVNAKDEFFTADALFLAAQYAEANNKNEDAITMYKRLRDEYPTSTAVLSGDIDKYLARLGIFE